MLFRSQEALHKEALGLRQELEARLLDHSADQLRELLHNHNNKPGKVVVPLPLVEELLNLHPDHREALLVAHLEEDLQREEVAAVVARQQAEDCQEANHTQRQPQQPCRQPQHHKQPPHQMGHSKGSRPPFLTAKGKRPFNS